MLNAVAVVLLSIISLTQVVVVNAKSQSTVIPASFVAPAAPTVTTLTAFPVNLPTTRDYKIPTTAYRITQTSSLYAKKKKNAPASTKKVQVKLLKHVAGTGQAGDVVQVTPAFFNNKLRPNKSAEIISDEQVEEERSQAEENDILRKAKASELQERLTDTTITIKRKAGPDGQLFGGIGAKIIMNEILAEIQDDFLEGKGVKVTEVLDGNGKKIRGDIKHIGDFGARVALLNGVSAKLAVAVREED